MLRACIIGGLLALLGPRLAAANENPIKSIGMRNTGEVLRGVWSRSATTSQLRLGPGQRIFRTPFSGSVVARERGKERLDYFLVTNTSHAAPGRRLHITPNQQIRATRTSGPGFWTALITYAGEEGNTGKRITEQVDVSFAKGQMTARFPGREGRAQGVGTYSPRTGKASVAFGGTTDTIVREAHHVSVDLPRGLALTEAVRALQEHLSSKLYGARPVFPGAR